MSRINAEFLGEADWHVKLAVQALITKEYVNIAYEGVFMRAQVVAMYSPIRYKLQDVMYIHEELVSYHIEVQSKDSPVSIIVPLIQGVIY